MSTKINKIIKTQIKKTSKFESKVPFECDKSNKSMIDPQSEDFSKIISKRSSLQQTCSICLCDIIDNEIISTLPCSERHCFHTLCLQDWFSNNTSCPICRTNFNTLFNNQEENVINANNTGNNRNIELNEINLREELI